MMAPEAPAPWDLPGWLDQVSGWAHAALADQGIAVPGAFVQHHRSRWSLVLRAATSAGTVYCKAMRPLPAFEPALTRALARWQPDCLPRVLGCDPARGWLLTLDAGRPLRQVLRAGHDVRHWLRVLPRYAALQVALTDRVEALLALGAPDRRPAAVARDVAQLVDDPEALRLDRPNGLTAAERQRLRALTPRVAALAAAVGGVGLPASLHHGDLHDGNVLVRARRYVFFDWGNSCVAHPFFSLRTALKSAQATFGWAADAPVLARLRDGYLEPWERYAPRPELLVALDGAHRLGMLSNALTWQRVLAARAAPSAGDDDEPVPRLLREFLTAQATADAPGSPRRDSLTFLDRES
jgi:hypothetical protein